MSMSIEGYDSRPVSAWAPAHDALGGFGERGDYTIHVQLPHILALVVTIGHREHRHARRPRRQRVVDRVADREAAGRLDTESAGGMMHLQRIGLAPLEGIAAHDHLKETRHATALEQ